MALLSHARPDDAEICWEMPSTSQEGSSKQATSELSADPEPSEPLQRGQDEGTDARKGR